MWRWLENKPNSIEITELPLHIWTGVFKEKLEKLMEEGGKVAPIVKVNLLLELL